MPIQILPQEVVNQIAAGEVVERPAHLLKELLENSLDAGADSIEIEIDHGGRWLRVRDNGGGMSAEDLVLAVQPHATSKIKQADDLWRLKSYGFRGEALASAAAISRMSITTRTLQDSQARRLCVEFGVQGEVEVVGGEFGTEIIVDDLFANVPARLKFLKSDAAEVAQIKMVLKALALAHPQLEMRVRYRGELLFYWPAQKKPDQRFCQVLEQAEAYWVEGICGSYLSEIVYTPPHVTAGNSRQIWLFVQGRWVQDRRLQAAVLEAYRTLLMHGEFPIAAVWLRCDPEEIDVNIHPSKSQVKFRDDQSAFRAVHHGLRKGLEAAPWLQGLLKKDSHASQIRESEPLAEPGRDWPSTVDGSARVEQSSAPYHNLQFYEPSFHHVQYQQKDLSYTESLLLSRPDRQPMASSHVGNAESSLPICQGVPTTDFAGRELLINDFVEPVARTSAYSEPAVGLEGSGAARWSSLQVLGQVQQTYIVAQSARGVVFVDQHAAHERVAFERLMAKWQGGEIEVQELLIPVEVEVDEDGAHALMGIETRLESVGLHLERLGPSLLGVKSMPALLREEAVVRALQKLAIEMVEQGDSFAWEQTMADVFATMACHSVVRAGQALSFLEMQGLLRQMDEFPLSSFCPHGRPVFVEYSFARLERDFGRTV